MHFCEKDRKIWRLKRARDESISEITSVIITSGEIRKSRRNWIGQMVKMERNNHAERRRGTAGLKLKA